MHHLKRLIYFGVIGLISGMLVIPILFNYSLKQTCTTILPTTDGQLPFYCWDLSFYQILMRFPKLLFQEPFIQIIILMFVTLFIILGVTYSLIREKMKK